MDEKLRQDATLKIKYAKKLEEKQSIKEKILNEYWGGINLFLQITNETIDDFKALSSAYYAIATIYFNNHQYTNAAECYEDSIKQLLKTKLNDSGYYRTLTERFIDLADAHSESINQLGAEASIENAITAFRLIEEKDAEELAIGDPDTHLVQFHSHYEHQLSTDSYLRSTKFLNHRTLLIERLQEKKLLAQFDNISIDDKKQIDDSIEHLLQQLSVSEQPKTQSFFNPILINQAPSDAEYRQRARQLLQLAQTHLKDNLIKNVIKTYEQAISALKIIQTPRELDWQTIKNLNDQILFLKTKTAQSPCSSSSSSSSSSAAYASSRFFSSSLQEVKNLSSTLEDPMDDDENEEEIDIGYYSN